MNNAEDRYLDLFQDGRLRNRSNKDSFLLGYHQAEEDLELTWEDMMVIHKCIKDAMNYHLYKMLEGVEGQKVVYQEVLKRFKDLKNGTTSK